MESTLLQEGGTIVALLFRRVGDSLMATPALRALKVKYPASRITVLCEPQVMRVFNGLTFVDRIVDVGRSPSSWKIVRAIRDESNVAASLDFLSDPRSAMACLFSGAPVRVGFVKSFRRFAYTHRISLQNPQAPVFSTVHKAALALALGAHVQNVLPEFALTAENVVAATLLMKQFEREEQRTVAMFVSSRRNYKRWPLERFAAIAKMIESRNCHPAIVSGPGESKDALEFCALSGLPQQNAVSFSDLGDMAAFLKQCAFYVGNDGGPKHLAVAVGTPTITIFQNDPAEYWTPPNHPQHVAVGGTGLSPSADEVIQVVQRFLV